MPVEMTESASEFIAIAGFLASIIGFLATLVSLYYAIRQVREAKCAAEAARDAANAVLAESKQNYLRYVVGSSHRFLNEAIIHIGNQAWHLAAVRMDDLADQIAQLANLDPQCQRLVDELRTWAMTTRRLTSGGLRRFPM